MTNAKFAMVSIQCLRKEIYILSIFDKAVCSFLVVFLVGSRDIEVCLPFKL